LIVAASAFCPPFSPAAVAAPQQDEDDSKYAYNSDDDTDYGMAAHMDV
jgi:hypothetical protein